MEQKESKSNKHFKISMLKSGVRMIGCGFLIVGSYTIAGMLLFTAECLGIVEEL
jgi:hypothetical protein